MSFRKFCGCVIVQMTNKEMSVGTFLTRHTEN